MILRLAVAYGAVHALVSSAIIVLAGILVGQHVVGVTRQPLPLIWPLSVMLVAAAQLPLREILGPLERVAARAVPARALRAGFSLLLIALAAGADAATHADPVLVAFLLLLVAVGFAAAALTPADPWVWTFGLGLGWVGLQFLTPMGQPMVSFLDTIGVATGAALALLTALLYVTTGRSRLVRRAD